MHLLLYWYLKFFKMDRYDRYELTFRSIIDVQFVSAMGPPGGGRNSVTNRYLRHFSVICVNAFSDITMNRFLFLFISIVFVCMWYDMFIFKMVILN